MTNNVQEAQVRLPKPISLPGLYKPGPQAQETFSICIYGKGGVGKTTLLGTMPGKGLVIDVPQSEGGTFVLEDKKDRIDIMPVTEWKTIQSIFDGLMNDKHDYRWVAIDSITAFTELAKRQTIKERDNALVVDPHTITLQEWGKVGRFLAELIYQFKKLPIHTIWVAQERKFGGEDDVGLSGMIGPDTTPSALSSLIPPMLLVGRMQVEAGADGWEHQLRIGPHPRYYSKCRAKPGLDVPSVVKNPRLDVLLKFLLGSGPRPEEASSNDVLISLA